VHFKILTPRETKGIRDHSIWVQAVENDVGQKESQGASSRIKQELEAMTDEQRRQFKGGKGII
jgi:hypothetical protein